MTTEHPSSAFEDATLAADAIGTDACCSVEQRATCCGPGEKGGCCDVEQAVGGGCGCR
ncbi:hypothetical protein [Actinotalea sp. K2]|uniref:hypothetical protein n=1 Tax=Actinotalea sp. K2 TaxID=2939438 RepID=UPI002017F0E2|nr:hypothetical protein [Actinotalea sp. K2]MCL3860686.1 hypothetical protein [Actinotalea sp. K2]